MAPSFVHGCCLVAVLPTRYLALQSRIRTPSAPHNCPTPRCKLFPSGIELCPTCLVVFSRGFLDLVDFLHICKISWSWPIDSFDLCSFRVSHRVFYGFRSSVVDLFCCWPCEMLAGTDWNSFDGTRNRTGVAHLPWMLCGALAGFRFPNFELSFASQI